MDKTRSIVRVWFTHSLQVVNVMMWMDASRWLVCPSAALNLSGRENTKEFHVQAKH